MRETEEYCPVDKAEWRKWLEVNHIEKEAVWLIFYKKKSSRYNLSWSESVDEALCFGWIDSVKLAIDEESYKQYFSKRKAKSIWSKINKDKVQTLIDRGLMKQAGMKCVQVAKDNGSWTIADKVEALEIPKDLEELLSAQEGSMEFFESLSKSAKKILLHWVVSAKREETRRKRISEIVENASRNMKPKQFR